MLYSIDDSDLMPVMRSYEGSSEAPQRRRAIQVPCFRGVTPQLACRKTRLPAFGNDYRRSCCLAEEFRIYSLAI